MRCVHIVQPVFVVIDAQPLHADHGRECLPIGRGFQAVPAADTQRRQLCEVLQGRQAVARGM